MPPARRSSRRSTWKRRSGQRPWLTTIGGEISSPGPYVGMNDPIHITIQGDADDPRSHMAAPPGIIIHRSPPLHLDDLDEIDGIPVTSLARTLVDLAEVSDEEELRWYSRRHAP